MLRLFGPRTRGRPTQVDPGIKNLHRVAADNLCSNEHGGSQNINGKTDMALADRNVAADVRNTAALVVFGPQAPPARSPGSGRASHYLPGDARGDANAS